MSRSWVTHLPVGLAVTPQEVNPSGGNLDHKQHVQALSRTVSTWKESAARIPSASYRRANGGSTRLLLQREARRGRWRRSPLVAGHEISGRPAL
jgi:hypothetical protein